MSPAGGYLGSHSRLRVALYVFACLLAAAPLHAAGGDSSGPSPETSANSAARLNNVGVALKDQQLPEKAIAKFDAAHAADPSAAAPVLNKGIGLLDLQRLDESEAALRQAVGLDAHDPHT
jgi:hypothetical protein